MLIVNGHASHVSTEFIRFAREHKIVCLCLPAHSTHLLQPLDVGVFGPLKQNYKTLLAEKTRFTTYSLDKADFISLIQKARQQGKYKISMASYRTYSVRSLRCFQQNFNPKYRKRHLTYH